MNQFVGRIEVLADPPALAHRVAEWMTATASAAKGRFRVALSGGSARARGFGGAPTEADGQRAITAHLEVQQTGFDIAHSTLGDFEMLVVKKDHKFIPAPAESLVLRADGCLHQAAGPLLLRPDARDGLSRGRGPRPAA